jgi:indole-3-glycerol phosphate synthase
VDLSTAFELAERMPKNVISVAESGIHSGAEIAKLHSAGFQAFLIGESLMKAESPGNALRTLIAEASPATTH